MLAGGCEWRHTTPKKYVLRLPTYLGERDALFTCSVLTGAAASLEALCTAMDTFVLFDAGALEGDFGTLNGHVCFGTLNYPVHPAQRPQRKQDHQYGPVSQYINAHNAGLPAPVLDKAN